MTRLRLWWQKTRKPLEVLGVTGICILMIALLVAIILAYIFNVDVPDLRGKTLWDWLQLLIIPAVLAIGGYVFNYTTSRNERNAADRHNQTEQEIAQDNQHEAALQEYIDKMSELLLEKKLRESQPEDEVRMVARVRTLTVLPRLDGRRKRSVLQFLHESGLIDGEKPVVDLKGADLSQADLSQTNLGGANLSETNLSKASLRRAQLNGVVLSCADLSEANLSEAHLERADLSQAILIGADLSNSHIRGKANLSCSNLRGANLSGADLKFADLWGADLNEATLVNTYLRLADLTQADLTGANLRKARLWDAKLTNADLTHADLRGADFKGVDDLKGADLEGAVLEGANLLETKLTRKQLKQAKSINGAIVSEEVYNLYITNAAN